MWNFGALSEKDEKQYVKLKVKMIFPGENSTSITSQLTELIVKSQNLMREYANKYISNNCRKKNLKFAVECAKSCVSQRDIQRVFTFYFWLMKTYKGRKNLEDPEQHALLVSLGLVYYLRLNSYYRILYVEEIDRCASFSGKVSFSEAFQDDIDWLISYLKIPNGIAQTKALKENLFAIVVCTCTKVPLIIVGKPGTSKTLSFHLALDNLKGIDSHNDLLRNAELFPALDPLVYQCSKQTTSFEIDTLFKRAIKRQATYSENINCVVFMDEAGLPEERHESLKILHQHLDERQVSFVAVSNHVLDAAKTNRAVSIVIPDTTEEDLRVLVEGCYSNNSITTEMTKYCPAILEIISDVRWKRLFGMRDFIHFIHYLHQKKQQLTKTLVLHALERNFNATSDFKDICDVFFEQEYIVSSANI